MEDEQDYSTWTSCEFYGHVFEDVEDSPSSHRCQDCGEEYED
jgi:hypothetical protein